ncbi:outer membrane protein assembly factor BamE [Phaeobacter sp. QD34_3]|uniref:outer membrane protein assembly factor BamE n=1 Tax=unclassified Phaeobacter TaxID=2621772 RepID=UPI00237FAB62|nr:MULTISPECIES: outer membrane protein assembly factor BamE [unclassified Phaeobacter]MDE4134173.1 outer membrane protein assembly factor BamE [Phaeobacter sp. QD34_3]MDE4137904.1 outer membrane protein assembly factor BamE [Phaeobacter sp. QD34_24]MDE4175143.1 outer membrane protein assembly factor BamE [Phaeobacter sp. PT47_59]
MGAQSFQLKTAMRRALLLLAAGSVAACAASYRKHGYVPSDEQLAEVVVGVDTRDSVAETIGVPGSSGVLNDSGYYYISTRMRHFGAAAPKPVSRDLVAVNFDKNGVVSGVQRFGLEDGRVIPLQRRVTSSSVQDKTFLRQLLGNLGNFGPGALLDE